MAEPETTGTPPDPGADGGSPAGTTPGQADGGLMAGLTPDQRALFQAQERKAAEGNAAIARAQAAEERLAAIERQMFQQQDPLTQRVLELNQRAIMGDADAAGELQMLTISATQQKELGLNDAMMQARVPQEFWMDVKALVRQSGYRMPVESALAQVRGGAEAPALQDRLKAVEAENARLKGVLEGRTPGSGRPNISTPPAVDDGGEGPVEMDPGEYQSTLDAGGPKAIALLKRGVKLRTG